jgi:tellurite resistance-related uncharacterized protein
VSSDPIDLALPDGLELARTTPEFDQDTVPPALLKAHQVAAEVWGRLVVAQGNLEFAFEDRAEEPSALGPGQSIVIPPQEPHRIIIVGPARFSVEFYRAAPTPS